MFSIEKQNNFSTRMFEGDNSSDVENCVDIYIKYYDFIIKQLNNDFVIICLIFVTRWVPARRARAHSAAKAGSRTQGAESKNSSQEIDFTH